MRRNFPSLFDSGKPLSERVALAFAEDGPLARATPGFRPRQSQIEFALAVAEALEGKETLLAEAGTGTGKSFAYLIPAILSGSVVVISTAGKPLQDQLFQKDIPALSAAFGVNIPTAVLKGRANYICPYRLERTEEEGLLPQRDSYRKLREIKRFAAVSPTGDRSELPTVPEDDPLWPLVTSTRENCLGKDKCTHWEDCFVRAAREKALQSQIVVVNHHLYLSSLALKSSAGGQIDGMLPSANLTVFDEAHQLPGIATDFFGTFFSTWQIEQISDESRYLGINHARDGADWDKLSHDARKAVYDLKIEANAIGLKEGDRKAVKTIERFGELEEPFAQALRTFGALGRDPPQGRESLRGLCAPRGHHFPQAGRGPPHPVGNRPRRLHAMRRENRREELRQVRHEEPSGLLQNEKSREGHSILQGPEALARVALSMSFSQASASKMPTTSRCMAPGNMSTGVTERSLRPEGESSAASRAKLFGLQEM